jgi:protein TonB
MQFHVLPPLTRHVDLHINAPVFTRRLKTVSQPIQPIRLLPHEQNPRPAAIIRPVAVDLAYEQAPAVNTTTESYANLHPAPMPKHGADPTQTSSMVTQQGTLELPYANADYLDNQPPVYPAISRRLLEQGTVVVRVLIGKNGLALQADIDQSSRFERLDQSALHAVLNWHYLPGKINGLAQDMWFKVPVKFKLN